MTKTNETAIVCGRSEVNILSMDRRRFLTTMGKSFLSASCLLSCPLLLGCERAPDAVTEDKTVAFPTSSDPYPLGISVENEKNYLRTPSTTLYPEVCQYFETRGSAVRCLLCPHQCVLKEGQRGLCGVRQNQDGRLMSLAYGKIMCYVSGPDYKLPLTLWFNDQPFLQIGSIGCQLRCSFCVFAGASFSRPEQVPLEYITPQEITDRAILNDALFISYSLNEMTVNYEHTIETAKLARARGIGNAFSTCGYLNPEPFRNLMQHMDWVFFSIKGTSDNFYKKHTAGRLAPILKNLKILGELNIPTEILYVLIPSLTDSDEHIKTMASWVIECFGEYAPVHFIRYVPANRLRNIPPIPLSRIEAAMKIARQSGLKYVVSWAHYWGFDRQLIAHDKLTRMVCPFCGKPVFQIIFTPEGIPDKILRYTDGIHCQWCQNQIYKVKFPA